MRLNSGGVIQCAVFVVLTALATLLPDTVFATTYAVVPYTFEWIDASDHTKIGPTTGGIYSSSYQFRNTGGCGTSPPTIDDTLADNIPLGFTFKYGSLGFSSVRIMSNGRLQFNDNKTCGFGSPVTQLPYPNSGLNYSMRVYGNDLDPTLSSEVKGYKTSCTDRKSCYVSYSTLGEAPNRKFVATWNHVPEWAAASSATGSYDLQVILLETGEFIYQYGDYVPGPNAKSGEIGWQISSTDYAVAGIGFAEKNSSFLFYIPNSGGQAPGDFNAFDTSTWVGSTSGVIQTKVAGTAFTLDVVALTSVPSVLTTFTGAVKVELVDGDSAKACADMKSIATITTSYSFKASEKGRHTFSSITVNDAYANVQVRMAYPASKPTTMACATDPFAIRPQGFNVVFSDGSWTTPGSARQLNAATANAAPVHKAGQPFSVVLTAYNANGNVTPSYQGTAEAKVVCVLPATACNAGSFQLGALTFKTGIASSDTVTYSEVGAVSVAITDSSFAKVDASDGTSLAQRSISSAAVTVGRFVPDRFAVVLNTPVFAPGCGTFSYVGQPVKYASVPAAAVSALNAGGGVAQNYTGSLWRINSADSTYGIKPNYSAAGQALTVLHSLPPVVVDGGNGKGTLTFADTGSNILAVTRGVPLAPFDVEIALSFSLMDMDGVAAEVDPLSFGAASPGNGMAFTGGNKDMRWGRLVLQNANGPELILLQVPLFSEYFNGNSFLKNVADNCTALNIGSQLSLSNPETADGAAQAGNASMTIGAGVSQAILPDATLAAGDADLSFAAPGSGNTGYIDIAADFTALPWLLFDWDHNGSHDNSPSARATFGIYQGNGKQIYRREVY